MIKKLTIGSLKVLIDSFCFSVKLYLTLIYVSHTSMVYFLVFKLEFKKKTEMMSVINRRSHIGNMTFYAPSLDTEFNVCLSSFGLM